MSIRALTKRTVDAARAAEKDYLIFDDTLPGFALKVTPTGTKVYLIQYRIPGMGRRANPKRMKLGNHGELTPDEARKFARRELARIAQGADPAAERKARRAGSTVADVGAAFVDDARTRSRSVSSHRERQRLLQKHVVPAIGPKLLSDVTTVELRRLHRSMHSTPYIANRVLALVAAIFSFGAKEGVFSGENPTRHVEPYPEEARERFLTPDEFRRLGASLLEAETRGLPAAPKKRRRPKLAKHRKHVPISAVMPIPANRYAIAAIRLLAMTGCREGEILSLRWDAVDLERGYLRLANTKTGRSVRPLGGAAMALLQQLRAAADEHAVYVLPGRKPGEHLKEIRRVWEAVRHASSLPDVRLHDLRHSFASVPASSGESLLVVRSMLGHANISTTERYAHLADDPVKRAADRASADIAAWMSNGRE